MPNRAEAMISDMMVIILNPMVNLNLPDADAFPGSFFFFVSLFFFAMIITS